MTIVFECGAALDNAQIYTSLLGDTPLEQAFPLLVIRKTPTSQRYICEILRPYALHFPSREQYSNRITPAHAERRSTKDVFLLSTPVPWQTQSPDLRFHVDKEPAPKEISEIDPNRIICWKTFPVHEGKADNTAVISVFGNVSMYSRKKMKMELGDQIWLYRMTESLQLLSPCSDWLLRLDLRSSRHCAISSGTVAGRAELHCTTYLHEVLSSVYRVRSATAGMWGYNDSDWNYDEYHGTSRILFIPEYRYIGRLFDSFLKARRDGKSAHLARRSDEALDVSVIVARIAPSLLDLVRGLDEGGGGESFPLLSRALKSAVYLEQHFREIAALATINSVTQVLGETGDPRENSPDSGIFWHNSHIQSPGVTPLGIEPGSPWLEASCLTTTPPRLSAIKCPYFKNELRNQQWGKEVWDCEYQEVKYVAGRLDYWTKSLNYSRPPPCFPIDRRRVKRTLRSDRPLKLMGILNIGDIPIAESALMGADEKASLGRGFVVGAVGPEPR
ncbi:hypothetical protein PR048_023033 [Dryococelus australis]|uniref:Heterokaryon incompatibility domain-containing protein n=1 Tax=Dryococelus australis TaxID=614101 RepID=A0ABQ9GSY0_9NEOP|nr:hypothetical protein PR048_023033 [Dryococelus australis]